MDMKQSISFAPQHPWDRNFFLGFILLSWLAVLFGFIPRLIPILEGHRQPPHPFMHIHAAGFFGWLVILTLQVGLIRFKKIDTHKLLGQFGAALAVVLVPLGIAAAVLSHRIALEAGQTSRLPFLSVQLFGMIIFGVLAYFAFVNRNNPSAHKRLIILATIELLGAGFGRITGRLMFQNFGDSLLTFPINLYIGSYAMILLAVFYDIFSRNKIHSVYLWGIPFIMMMHIVMSWVNHAQWWPSLAQKLIGY
jgi:hypothetical protein